MHIHERSLLKKKQVLFYASESTNFSMSGSSQASGSISRSPLSSLVESTEDRDGDRRDFLCLRGRASLVRPEMYLKIMPPYIPWHVAMVRISGILEIAGEAGKADR